MQTSVQYSTVQYSSRELLLRIFGGRVRLGSPNPDPISDQNMSFSGTPFQTWPLKFISISDMVS